MRKEKELEIKRDVYNYAWRKYKSEHTMEELGKKVFNTSLASFYRILANKITNPAHLSQLEVIDKAIEKCQEKK